MSHMSHLGHSEHSKVLIGWLISHFDIGHMSHFMAGHSALKGSLLLLSLTLTAEHSLRPAALQLSRAKGITLFGDAGSHGLRSLLYKRGAPH